MLSCVTVLKMAQPVPAHPTATATEFDRLLHVDPVPGARDRFTTQLPEEWSALVGIHGGYLTALAVRAAGLVVPDWDARTLTTSFLRAARPGPAELRVSELRRTRSISTVLVELAQDGRTLTTTRLTLVAQQDGIEWRPFEPIPLPPLDECVPIEPREPSAHFERAQGRLDPSSLPFTDGPRAIVSGYLRPLEARPIDAAWLAMASDWFPPPAFVRLEPPLGGISVDLTTHVHAALPALADDEWLTAAFEITTSAGGIATEHGRIATTDGHLLAESFQTRWMVPR